MLDEEEIVVVAVVLQEQDETEAMDASHDDTNVDSKSCAIIECDESSSEDLLWCSICELWFCKDLHGPHKSHSAQTIFKEGRIPKNHAGEIEDVVTEKKVADEVAVEVKGTGKKRRRSAELDATIQIVKSYDRVRLMWQ
jgi:hypothetical protein